MTDADLATLAPALILAASAAITALLASTGRVGVRALGWLGAAASIAAAATAIAIGPATVSGGTVKGDGASLFFVVLIGVVATTSLALGRDDVALVLFSAAGAVVVVSAADLMVLFVGLALLTVPTYVLTARRSSQRGDDGATRHFLLGAVSTAVAVYGFALLYAATGETSYLGLGRATHNPLYLGGLGLALAGLAFHLVLSPAQRPSIVVNVATVGALLRLVAVTRRGEVALDWEVSLAVLAAVGLVVAGLAALTERRLRRLVAYATISQLGYVFIAAAGSSAPAAAFAIAAYAAVSIGLFGVLAAVPRDEPVLDDLAGLARQRPLLVLGLGVVVLGLLGVPPAMGFVARLYVFEVAVRAQLLWLMIVGALAAVVSVASYARLVLACLAPPRLDRVAPPRARLATAVVLLAALAILSLGVFPGPLLEAAQVVRF